MSAAWLRVLAIFVCMMSPLLGQPTRLRQIRFTVFSATPIDGLLFYPADKKPATPLTFYPTARSQVYDYLGEEVLKFYRIRTDPTSGSLVSVAVAEVKIPEPSSEVLLLFSPNERGGSGAPEYRVQVLDDSAVQMAPGAVRILNLSGLVLEGSIGSRRLTVEEGLSSSLPLAKSARIDLRTLFRGRLYPAYAETLELKPHDRGLLILFPPFRAGSLEVQSRLLIDEKAMGSEKRDTSFPRK